MERSEYILFILLLVIVAIAMLLSDALNSFTTGSAVIGAAAGTP